jgi:exosortase A-associated hydrolase 2
LLVPALLQKARRDASVLLWQPVASGKQYLNHLLRLKLAGGIVNRGETSASPQGLRAKLRAGETLEVGGYAVSARLAEEMEAAAFEIPRAHRGQVAWFEITTSASASLSPAARAHIDGARAFGSVVTASVVKGPGFWQSVEIEHCEALIVESAATLCGDAIDAIRRDPAVL